MTQPLLVQRQIHVTPNAQPYAISAEVSIDECHIRWEVLSLRNGEGWEIYTSHSTPEGWTGLIRLPKFRHHEPPQDAASMIAFCRWFFEPKTEVPS